MNSEKHMKAQESGIKEASGRWVLALQLIATLLETSAQQRDIETRVPRQNVSTTASSALSQQVHISVGRSYGQGASISRSNGNNFYHFAVRIRPKMRRYFPRQRDETFAGRSEEVVASAGRRTVMPPRKLVMRMLRLHSAQAKSKQDLSRLAGSGGSVVRVGISTVQTTFHNRTETSQPSTISEKVLDSISIRIDHE